MLAELSRRGWSTGDLEKLAGRNLLRVLRAAEQTALTLRTEIRASDARLDDETEPATAGH